MARLDRWMGLLTRTVATTMAVACTVRFVRLGCGALNTKAHNSIQPPFHNEAVVVVAVTTTAVINLWITRHL
jgi:hypothetical protein